MNNWQTKIGDKEYFTVLESAIEKSLVEVFQKLTRNAD